MEMYQILLNRLTLLTDEYLELCKEIKEIKSHLRYENEKENDFTREPAPFNGSSFRRYAAGCMGRYAVQRVCGR